MAVLIQVYRFLSGYGFAVFLLGCLLLLTFLGTIAQVDQSLFEAQQRYFEALFIVEDFGPVAFPFPGIAWLVGVLFANLLLLGLVRHVPTRVLYLVFTNGVAAWLLFVGGRVPLPGVALLLTCLFVNLTLGGLVRIRKRGATAGVMVAHVGILMLLVAGIVEWSRSTKGHMTLYPGESAQEYVSFFEWEIVAFENGGTREYVVPGDRFMALRHGESATFAHPDLPFSFQIDSVYKNSRVVLDSPGGDDPSLARHRLQQLPQMTEAEADAAGCHVAVRTKGGADDGKRSILWGRQVLPVTVQADDGKLWLLHMQRRRWLVPFDIRLDEFRKDDHPGTAMARSFESDVTMTDFGATERVTISMNNPLRHRGYTLFQSSWGPKDPGPREPLYSQFSVVRNPADAWPLYACWIIGIGLFLHFARKLVLFLGSRARARNVPLAQANPAHDAERAQPGPAASAMLPLGSEGRSA